jgi:effector-binding domain-containing protein
MMKAVTITLLAASALLLAGNSVAVEEAKYTVSLQDEAIEIRQYEASIIAEVIVEGSFEEASNTAFRKLFNYISGSNTSRDEIAMTAPVSQRPQAEKIAMTAPVGQQAAERGWAVSFMMPAAYTMETIPLPTDTSIVLKEVPAHTAAAIRYSGTWSKNRYEKHLAQLQTWIDDNGLEPAGEPLWARYNAPFVPWFMRRNEILIPIAL